MRHMQERYKISFIFSSHDREVIGAADDLIYLKDGQIQQIRRRKTTEEESTVSSSFPETRFVP